MRLLKSLLISLVIITVLGLISPNVNAVIFPTATAPGITPITLMLPASPAVSPTIGVGGLTPLMVAPIPTVAPGVIGGGIGLWPTALMLPSVSTVPTAAAAFPSFMLTPTTPTIAPTFTPSVASTFGGIGLTPLMVAPAPSVTPTFGGGIGLTPLMVAPAPSVTPTFGGGIGLTPLMVAPAPTISVGGTSFWPTAIMLPTTAPLPSTGAIFPVAMPPVI